MNRSADLGRIPAFALLLSLLGFLGAGTAPLRAQSLDARNMGMGGGGVASGDFSSASLVNPALLTRFDPGDDIAIVIPSIGVAANDEDGLGNQLDQFRDMWEDLGAKIDNATATPADAQALVDQLFALQSKTLSIQGELGLRVSVPSKEIAWGVFATTRLHGLAMPDIDPADQGRILGATSSADLDNLQSAAFFFAAMTTEVGVSLAHSHQWESLELAVGVSPKYQRIETFNYSVSVQNYEDLDDFDDDKFRTDDAAANVDAGASLTYDERLTFGFSARNLIRQRVDTILNNGRQFTYELAPKFIAGASWRPFEMLTLTGDIDLNTTRHFVESGGDDMRSANAGLEIDLWKWLMLRAGYRFDLDGAQGDMITAGVGVGLFDTIKLDVAAFVSPDRSTTIDGESTDIYGAALQLMFKF